MKIFGFVKKVLFTGLTILSSLACVNSLKCISMSTMSRTNEKRHIKWHETCKCKCRLDAIVCNNKQRWNKDKCQCECKELIDKGVCDKGFIWNPSNYECNKSCDIGEYLDYENCKCRTTLIDKLADECTETVEEKKPAIITLSKNKNIYKCSSSVVYTILVWIFFAINIDGIGTYFVYFYWYLNKYSPYVGFNTCKSTTIY